MMKKEQYMYKDSEKSVDYSKFFTLKKKDREKVQNYLKSEQQVFEDDKIHKLYNPPNIYLNAIGGWKLFFRTAIVVMINIILGSFLLSQILWKNPKINLSSIQGYNFNAENLNIIFGLTVSNGNIVPITIKDLALTCYALIGTDMHQVGNINMKLEKKISPLTTENNLKFSYNFKLNNDVYDILLNVKFNSHFILEGNVFYDDFIWSNLSSKIGNF